MNWVGTRSPQPSQVYARLTGIRTPVEKPRVIEAPFRRRRAEARSPVGATSRVRSQDHSSKPGPLSFVAPHKATIMIMRSFSMTS